MIRRTIQQAIEQSRFKGTAIIIESYEQTQKTLALLKILARGSRQVEAGKVESAADVIQRLRKQRKDR